MTAQNSTPEGEKEVTGSTADLERSILDLMDDARLDYIDVETLIYNLDAPGDVTAAVEELEHRGELKSLPVIYERV